MMKQWLRAYLRVCEARPLLVLSVAVAACLLALTAAMRIKVNASLSAMLPEDSPSLKALNTFKRRVASTSSLYLLVSSSDEDQNRRLAAKLVDAVKQWPDTRWAIDRRDPSFFVARRLLFLPAARIDAFANQVEERLNWQRCSASPACVTLSDAPPIPSQDDVVKAYRDDPNVAALLSLFGAGGSVAPLVAASTPMQAGGSQPGQLCSPRGDLCVVEAALKGDPDDIAYATRIADKAEALFAQVRPPDAPHDLRMVVSGAYRNGPMEQKIVSRDLLWTTVLGGLLMAALMIVQFPARRTLVLLVLPLAAGITYTLGIIGLMHPNLDILSAFGLSVLGGLGIDFGIHLCTHYGDLRGQDVPLPLALSCTLEELAGPMVAAAGTTACGFLVLLVARFRGFSTMGALAALGVCVFFVSYTLLFAPVVHVLARLRPERAARMAARQLPRWPLPGTSRTRFYVGIALAVGLGALGTTISFEYDFRRLRPPEVSHGLAWGKALHGSTRTPVFILGASAGETQLVADALRLEGRGALGAADGDWIFTAASFVPQDQDARLRALARFKALGQRALPFMTDHQSETYRRVWIPLLDVRPFAPSDLPAWVQDWLFERDGRFGALAVAYFDLSGSNAKDMQRLAEKLAVWRERFPNVTFASPAALVGEVIPGLAHDAPAMLLLACLGLMLGTFAVGRSWRRTVLVMTPLAVGLAWALGLAVIFDVKIHLYNIIMLPLAFGMGVDGAIYVVWSEHAPTTSSRSASLAVLTSSLTTMVAFGSLMVAHNPGIASLGKLALIAIGSTVPANLIWLPALLERLRHRAT